MKQEEIVAGSYILTFYQEVQNLSHYYAQYLDIMLRLKMTITTEEKLAKLDETTTQELRNALINLRYSAHKTQIQYLSIIDSIKATTNKKLQDIYTKIKQTYIIPIEDIETYTLELNKELTRAVIKDLLETSQQYIQNIYPNEQQKNQDKPL